MKTRLSGIFCCADSTDGPKILKIQRVSGVVHKTALGGPRLMEGSGPHSAPSLYQRDDEGGYQPVGPAGRR